MARPGEAGRIRTPVYASTGLRIGRTAGPPRTRPAESGKVAIRTQRAVSISPCSIFRPNFFGRSFGRKSGAQGALYVKNAPISTCRINNAKIARLLHTQEI